jgi:hypothetical protein
MERGGTGGKIYLCKGLGEKRRAVKREKKRFRSARVRGREESLFM